MAAILYCSEILIIAIIGFKNGDWKHVYPWSLFCLLVLNILSIVLIIHTGSLLAWFTFWISTAFLVPVVIYEAIDTVSQSFAKRRKPCFKSN